MHQHPTLEKGEEYKVLSQGALVNTLGMIFRISRALSLILFARFLGATDFGLYILVWGLTEIVQRLGLMGLQAGALWRSSELVAKGEVGEVRPTAFRILGLGLSLGIFITILINFFAPWIAETFFQKPIIAKPWAIFCLTVPFFIGSRILIFALRSTLKMHYEVLVISVLEPALILTVGVTLLWQNLGLQGVLIAHIVASLGGFLLAFLFFNKCYSTSSQTLSLKWRPLLSYSFFAGGVDILIMTKQKLDLIVLAHFLTLEMVGFYGALTEVGFIIRKIRGAFESILAPLISRLRVEGNKARLKNQFVVSIRWVLIVSLGFYGILWLNPGPILKMFGASFIIGTTALLIFSLGELFHATLGMMEVDLSMAGKTNIIFLNWTATLIFNFVLLYFLVPPLELNGAAIATASTFILMSWVRVFQIKKLEGVFPFHASQAKVILAAILSLFAGFFLSPYLFLPFYLFCLKLLGLEKEDQDAWERFKARFRMARS